MVTTGKKNNFIYFPELCKMLGLKVILNMTPGNTEPGKL